jgi:hypothetical protein
MSERASQAILQLAIDDGINVAATVASIDRSSVSRLVSAKTDEYLAANERPDLASLSWESANIVVSDALGGGPVAYFDRLINPALPNWLSKPTLPVVLPDAKIAPHILAWTDRTAVTLTKHAFLSLIALPLRRAARKMSALIKTTFDIERVSDLLSAKVSSLSTVDALEISRIAAPGTPARNFLRIRDRFLGIYDAVGISEARARLADTIDACADAWKDIFSPVIDFLTAYKPMILSHPACLIACSPAPRIGAQGPANLLTLGIRRNYVPECHYSRDTSPQYI